MSSTFAGVGYFNSGPHRFTAGRLGRLVSPPFESPLTGALPYSVNEARRELTVVQRGRLVAATPAALWALADAIQAQAELPRNGTLIDHTGRSWTNLTLVRFTPGDRLDRGRVVSLAYTALYLRFGP